MKITIKYLELKKVKTTNYAHASACGLSIGPENISASDPAGLHLLMAHLADKGYPMELIRKLRKNKYGKPYFSTEKPFFNISHSHNLIICCFSKQNECGIDIESPIKKLHLTDFETVFDTMEKEYLNDSSPTELLRLWTRKEAFIKAAGVNIDFPLHEINVLGKTISNNESNWNLEDLSDHCNFFATLCWRTNENESSEEEISCYWTHRSF